MENKYLLFLLLLSFVNLHPKNEIVSCKEDSSHAKYYTPHEIKNITPEESNHFNTQIIYQGQSLDSLIENEKEQILGMPKKNRRIFKIMYDPKQNPLQVTEVIFNNNNEKTHEIYDVSRSDGLQRALYNPKTQKPERYIFDSTRRQDHMKEDIFNHEGNRIKILYDDIQRDDNLQVVIYNPNTGQRQRFIYNAEKQSDHLQEIILHDETNSKKEEIYNPNKNNYGLQQALFNEFGKKIQEMYIPNETNSYLKEIHYNPNVNDDGDEIKTKQIYDSQHSPRGIIESIFNEFGEKIKQIHDETVEKDGLKEMYIDPETGKKTSEIYNSEKHPSSIEEIHYDQQGVIIKQVSVM